ncbi:MAG TPA: response regulator transcription factor [Vicinamibacterales bacterium]|jgi:two-component system copper resistance phosphate regulon response regulator CusR
MRILLVEDERSASRMLMKGLREHGFAVDHAGDGRSALDRAVSTLYDAIVLDVMLPSMNGLEVCRELRASGRAVPVLMLTARDGLDDLVGGLEAGADDYLTKPFRFAELLARLNALTRRRMRPLIAEHVACGPLVLNTRRHEARVSGRLIDLTAREYALLEYLCLRPGVVISREEIAERVWDDRYDPCSNVIDVYVRRLRRKIDEDGASFIRTRRGSGYQLLDAADQEA